MGTENQEQESEFQDIFGFADLNLDKYEKEDKEDKDDPAEEVEEVEVKVDKNTDPESDEEEEESQEGDDSEEEEDDKDKDKGGDDADVEDVEAVEVDLKNVFQTLVDDEVLLYDEDKEYDLSVDGFKEVIRDTTTKAKSQALLEYKEKLDTEGKDLLEILESGGSVEDYLNNKNEVNFSDVPLIRDGEPIVQNQKYIVQDWYKVQGYTDEEIKEKLADLETSDLLEKEAKFSKNKLVQWQDKRREEQKAERAEAAKKEQERSAKEAEEFKNMVLNLEDVAGFKLTPKDRTKLYDYVTVKNKDGKTQFEADDTDQNRMLYAFFAMSGFNKEKLSKEVATKAAIKLKKTLSNHRDTNANPRNSEQRVRRGESEKLDLSEWKL